MSEVEMRQAEDKQLETIEALPGVFCERYLIFEGDRDY